MKDCQMIGPGELNKKEEDLLKQLADGPMVWCHLKQEWISPDEVEIDPDFVAAGVRSMPGAYTTPEMKAMWAKLPVDDYPAWEAEMQPYWDMAKRDFLFDLAQGKVRGS
jgi:hypothetical protein